MHIDDKQLGNVGAALAHYSEYLNDNKPSDPLMVKYWELTRREVWTLRDELESYYQSLPSSAESQHVHTQACYAVTFGELQCGHE